MALKEHSLNTCITSYLSPFFKGYTFDIIPKSSLSSKQEVGQISAKIRKIFQNKDENQKNS